MRPPLVMCYTCDTFHWNEDGPCPECGAGFRQQCWTTPDGKSVFTAENLAKAHRAWAKRLRRQANEQEQKALELESGRVFVTPWEV